MKAIFFEIYYFAAVSIFSGWLLFNYATVYTMAPVFSLVLDTDVPSKIALQFPELYKSLQKGRDLCARTFFQWLTASVYQGGIIVLMTLFLFEDSFLNIVSITFTSLILTELLNVALEIHHWNRLMIISELLTLFVYVASMFILTSYFDITFILSFHFLWKTCLTTLVSCSVPFFFSRLALFLSPPVYSKLTEKHFAGFFSI